MLSYKSAIVLITMLWSSIWAMFCVHKSHVALCRLFTQYLVGFKAHLCAAYLVEVRVSHPNVSYISLLLCERGLYMLNAPHFSEHVDLMGHCA